MKKILWFSNKVQSTQEQNSTGAWLDTMAHALVQSGHVQLANITMGPVRQIVRRDVDNITQWIIPTIAQKYLQNGLPPTSTVEEICHLVDSFAPDLIHVWGTESFWGLLSARKFIRYPVLLEMQGIKGAIANVYHGGLTIREQVKCIGVKEIIRQSSIFHGYNQFKKWGDFEQEIIRAHSYVTTQTDWVRAQVKTINSNCQIFHNDLLLREPFFNDMWNVNDDPVVFCSSAHPVPYKGIHVAIRAISILKKWFPNIKLRIAGNNPVNGIRRDGYIVWLRNQTKKLNIEDNIIWLGPLNAHQIVREMRSASAMVIPTFIENCSTAMQEAMAFGIPLVVSYVGGLPSIANDNVSALFFSPGDAVMCANQLRKILIDRDLALSLSKNARELALVRNSQKTIVSRQIDIYDTII